MATNVKTDEIASTITKWLTEYTEDVTDIAKEVVDEIADGVMEETKAHITWYDKEYSNSFALKTSFENARSKMTNMDREKILEIILMDYMRNNLWDI